MTDNDSGAKPTNTRPQDVPLDQTLSARQRLVETARQAWIRSLIDPSRRNNMLFFRDLKNGTLSLDQCDREVLSELFNGKKVGLESLLPELELKSVESKAREIMRRARGFEEEKGLDTLFLAVGMASWDTEDGGTPTASPILFFPIEMESSGPAGRRIALTISGEPNLNMVLTYQLDELGIDISEDEFLSEESLSLNSIQELFNKLKSRAGRLKGFVVQDRYVIGIFTFQKMSMVRDLRDNFNKLVEHDMIAALSGDEDSRRKYSSSTMKLNYEDLDQIPASEEFLIRDADSSQQRAIHCVLRGQDAVIQGPPGTGKSQTISNLIGSLVAAGKKVLFVAEKRAALDVVKDRIAQLGLGHIMLDLHGAAVNRKKLIEQVRLALEKVRTAQPHDANHINNQFEDRRQKLNVHVKRLHVARKPSGLSVFEIMGKMLRIPENARSSVLWKGDQLDRLTSESTGKINSLLKEAGGFGELFLRQSSFPWNGAVIANAVEAREALDLATNLANNGIPNLNKLLEILISEFKPKLTLSLSNIKKLLGLLVSVMETTKNYHADIYQIDIAQCIAKLTPAKDGEIKTFWAFCTKPEFRETRKIILSLRKSKPANTKALLMELIGISNELNDWQSCFEIKWPQEFEKAKELSDAFNGVVSQIDRLNQFIQRKDVHQTTVNEIHKFVSDLSHDNVTPFRIPRLLEIEAELKLFGVDSFISDLRTWNKPPAQIWITAFEYSWLSSCLQRAREEDPGIAGFNGQTQDIFVHEFTKYDRQRFNAARNGVVRAHAEKAVLAMNNHQDQESVIRKEAERTRPRLPLRKLLQQTEDVLLSLCPVWMASPLSVSNLLPAEKQYFDLVIFDEASQVLPEDSIPAILRGKRIVVAGDSHQLPPTTFFMSRSEEDDELPDEESNAQGFQSILDMLNSFLPSYPLLWHYRSKHESLIAFSNRHIYGDSLITLPSAHLLDCIKHEFVDWKAPAEGASELSSSGEIERVIALVLDHARNRPEESLGVITLGIKHAQRLEACLEDKLMMETSQDPKLADFFDPHKRERFFVKNLERVQGDERDAIILSVGYCKNPTGVLLARFGPLTHEGGVRRLNVAISRARRRMTVVSSFQPHDMDPTRFQSEGANLLRDYLSFVSSGGRFVTTGHETHEPMNEFEMDVFDTLKSNGVPVVPQYGVSKYRIDLVAKHNDPQKAGQFVLAIECDGASYHSSRTARDRDRLRQQHLEELGWRFVRIWSTDWFMNKSNEVVRVKEAYLQALEFADGKNYGTTMNDRPKESHSAGASAPQKAVRKLPAPVILKESDIDRYSFPELSKIVQWILSDGTQPTDAQIIDEVAEYLGFTRKGRRIVERIQQAIVYARREFHGQF